MPRHEIAPCGRSEVSFGTIAAAEPLPLPYPSPPLVPLCTAVPAIAFLKSEGAAEGGGWQLIPHQGLGGSQLAASSQPDPPSTEEGTGEGTDGLRKVPGGRAFLGGKKSRTHRVGRLGRWTPPLGAKRLPSLPPPHRPPLNGIYPGVDMEGLGSGCMPAAFFQPGSPSTHLTATKTS